MEKKIIKILTENGNGFDVSKLGLNYRHKNNLIEDIELVEGVILFHTENGDVGSLDMLTKKKQNQIFAYIQK